MCEECVQAEMAEAKAAEAAKAAVPSRRLTNGQVLENEPCSTYRERMNERFPLYVDVTVELAVSQAEDWDWFWAANELLSPKGFGAWREVENKTIGEYRVQISPFEKLADSVGAEASKARRAMVEDLQQGGMGYWEAGDKSWEVYDRAVEPAYAAVEAVRSILSKRMNETLAKAWAEIYISEGEQNKTAD